MKDLAEIRDEIDRIDEQIVQLYEERMKLTGAVAEYKIANHKKVLDRERELKKLAMVSGKAKEDFNRQAVKELFEQIISVSRKRQYQMMGDCNTTELLDFTCIGDIDCTNARVVFQGVEGAYSHQAMMEYFGTACDSFHVDTWKDAMEAIRTKAADYAVLPIENSSAGIVSENYDLLVEYDNYIVGEQILKIDHALLGLPNAKLTDITNVYSHPQALMQCAEYLGAHREWEKVSLKNTAMAAQKVKDDGMICQAAIAGAVNAEIYGLKVLEPAIQDTRNNSTRFIIVSGEKVYRSSARKISICFEIPHESGSLYHMLSHFIYNNLNLTSIQSRPLRDRNWEYRFFVDFDGTLLDSGVVNALHGLKEEAVSLRILGTY